MKKYYLGEPFRSYRVAGSLPSPVSLKIGISTKPIYFSFLRTLPSANSKTLNSSINFVSDVGSAELWKNIFRYSHCE